MFSHTDSIYANRLEIQTVDEDNFDIVNPRGEILLNGVAPGGGGGSLPIIGTGDITVTGNITANGDGLSNGKMEAQTIKSVDNIVISSGSLEVTTGGVDIKANGNLSLEGNGDINVLGTGNIGVGTGGITSVGDIQTSSGDIVSAGDIFFEGDDIKHRTESGGVVTNTSYVAYKQLAQKNANNTFTGANKFDDNVNEFSERVSVGVRDAQGLFTQNLALNNSGNLESQTINNASTITCGNVNCDNGGVNSCAAKTFTTRTSGLAGWTIEQQTVQGDALDNVLQMKGGQAGAYISIIDSAFSGFVPNITLDPRTTALGGQIQTDLFRVGDGANAFDITQPKSGADSNNLLIKAGTGNTPIKFQNNAGTIDLVRIEPDGTDGSGRIYCPAIFFGTTGVHNSIVNDVSGSGNLNLKIRQATASSEVLFLDNDDAELIRIQKTQVELKDDIPLLFGNYSFRPQQYSLSNTTFPIESNATNFTKLFTSNSTFTNVNTGGTGQLIEGFYKLTVSQIGASTNSNYETLAVMSDFVFRIPSDALPNNQLPNPLSFSYGKYLTSGNPVIEIRRNATGVQDIHMFFPTSGQPSGETMSIVVKLTLMPY